MIKRFDETAHKILPKNKNFMFLYMSVEMPHEVGQSLRHKVLFVVDYESLIR